MNTPTWNVTLPFNNKLYWTNEFALGWKNTNRSLQLTDLSKLEKSTQIVFSYVYLFYWSFWAKFWTLNCKLCFWRKKYWLLIIWRKLKKYFRCFWYNHTFKLSKFEFALIDLKWKELRSLNFEYSDAIWYMNRTTRNAQ